MPAIEISNEVLAATVGALGLGFAAWIGARKAHSGKLEAEASPGLNKLLTFTADRVNEMADKVAVIDHELEEIKNQERATKHVLRNILQLLQIALPEKYAELRANLERRGFGDMDD